MDAPAAGQSRQVGASERAGRSVDRAALGLSAILPACLAAAQIGNVADAAHDGGLARVVLLTPRPWRALDVIVDALFAAVPLGTVSARAEAGGALVVGASGAMLYLLTRSLLGACAAAPRVSAVVAAIASLSALLAPIWQLEGSSPGGSATGALLIFAPVALFALWEREGDAAGGASVRRWGTLAAALGLALGYEPLVGAASFGASAAFVAWSPELRRSLSTTWSRAAPSEDRATLCACAVGGLAPMLLALARTRASGAPLASALADAWSGERGASLAGWPADLLRTELGVAGGTLSLAGLALALSVRKARPLTGALGVVAAIGLLAGWVEPLGPTRFGAPILAAVAAAWALAGVAMQAIVRAVGRARVPFARASAALVVVIESAIPFEAADEALLRALPRAQGSAAIWDDCVWGVLPPRTAVLLSDRRLYERALAARAGGSLRADIALVPSFAPATPGAPGQRGRDDVGADEALVPLWRDLELTGTPSEASLASLAAARPLAMAYEPRSGRGLARHFVALSLLDRFEPEPRGASDRRRALDTVAPRIASLALTCAHEQELAGAAAYLLRARAQALAASGDHDGDALTRAAANIELFAPGDPAAAALAPRPPSGPAHTPGPLEDRR